MQHKRRGYHRNARQYVRIKERDADTFMGDDKNGIKISCGIIWNKASPVLRPAAGASNLNKAGFTELLHDEIRCVSLSGTDCRT